MRAKLAVLLVFAVLVAADSAVARREPACPPPALDLAMWRAPRALVEARSGVFGLSALTYALPTAPAAVPPACPRTVVPFAPMPDVASPTLREAIRVPLRRGEVVRITLGYRVVAVTARGLGSEPRVTASESGRLAWRVRARGAGRARLLVESERGVTVVYSFSFRVRSGADGFVRRAARAYGRVRGGRILHATARLP